MGLLLGIDDAGRGPVLGPMVLAGVLIKKQDEKELKEWGAKDSKQVKKEKREEIAEKIKKKFSFASEIIHAHEIDTKTNNGINLNRIEAIAAARIVNELAEKTENSEIIEVYIDCPSPNCENWKAVVERYIKAEIKKRIKIHAEHKADVNHVVCSGASIIAKTTRDSEIEKIKKDLGCDFGSGYASDELTMQFVRDNFSILKEKKLIRECWDTCKQIKKEKEQKKLF